MSIRDGAVPRQEVLESELSDAIFAADFGDLIDGSAPEVYRAAETFFRNTYPTEQLTRIVRAVFGRLANSTEPGAVLRLSTGFGGGKTHTLMTLWHLAENIDNYGIGSELLPSAGRPHRVHVAAADAASAGTAIFADHGTIQTSSLWGELAYRLGGAEAWFKIREVDNPEAQPAESQFQAILPNEPVLFLLDELVVYMATLNETGKGNLLAFLQKLMRICSSEPGKVLVVSDPAGQATYQAEASQLDSALQVEAAGRLDELIGRQASDFDPIGQETAQVITRRLFQSIDQEAANKVSADYGRLYERLHQSAPHLLPGRAATATYAQQFAASYPFHPRLLETARNRLGAMQDFQQSRGTLRLFARLIRTIWNQQRDLDVISAGDIDWSQASIQGELLARINRDNFRSAVDADVLGHARELDGDEPFGVHQRAASALLLESLPMEMNSGLDEGELTLAIVRPEEAGHEPVEAMDRLAGVCWHTYPMEAGRGWQFRYQANVVKQIEERMDRISEQDALERVKASVQSYFSGPTFHNANWPRQASEVGESLRLTLVLAESEEIAQTVVNNSDDAAAGGAMPRRFINAVVGVAPTPSALDNAVMRARRQLAADEVQGEYRRAPEGKLVREQLDRILPEYTKQMRFQACRAFDIVLTHNRRATMEERYLVAENDVMGSLQGKGQPGLLRFLEDKGWIYAEHDALDVPRFINIALRGATPVSGQQDVWTAKALHERILGAPDLQLLRDAGLVTRTIIRAVSAGDLIVRTADGTAYDRDGAVAGPESNRRRMEGQRVQGLSATENVLITKPGSQAAGEWLAISPAQPAPGGGTGPEPPLPPPPPPGPGRETATNWNTAAELAHERPLIRLTLEATRPESAAKLMEVAQPLGAEGLYLTVNVHGELRSGGQAGFQVRHAKPNNPIKPLDTARTLYNATGGNGGFEATLDLEFGDSGRVGMADVLENISGAANNAGLLMEARFGEPADGGS